MNETDGTVVVNADTIETNKGRVKKNLEENVEEDTDGKICTNYGIVEVNAGTVTQNESSGKVYGNTGIIVTNKGLATPDSAPAEKPEEKHEYKSEEKDKSAEPTPYQIEVEAIFCSFESQIASIGSSSNGTATIDGKNLVNSLPVAIMKKIAGHPNVSVLFTYIYRGVKYTTVIPAGATIDTSIEWFGPAYLMRHYPTIANQANGSQVYVISPIK